MKKHHNHISTASVAPRPFLHDHAWNASATPRPFKLGKGRNALHGRSVNGFAVCIAGAVRAGMFTAWPSFLEQVAPHADDIYVNIAAPSNCSKEVFQDHPKVVTWKVELGYDDWRVLGGVSTPSWFGTQVSHDTRESHCLQMIREQNRTYTTVLMTRPDVVYSDAFPFHALVPSPRTIYVPLGSDHGGLNDQMVVGDLPSLEAYTGWSAYVDPKRRIAASGPEAALAMHVRKRGLRVLRFYYEYAIIRPRDIGVARLAGLKLFAAFNHEFRGWSFNMHTNPTMNQEFLHIVAANTTCTSIVVAGRETSAAVPPAAQCKRHELRHLCPSETVDRRQLESDKAVASVVCGKKAQGTNTADMTRLTARALCGTLGLPLPASQKPMHGAVLRQQLWMHSCNKVFTTGEECLLPDAQQTAIHVSSNGMK
mgnify:CR=1 FL=1